MRRAESFQRIAPPRLIRAPAAGGALACRGDDVMPGATPGARPQLSGGPAAARWKLLGITLGALRGVEPFARIRQGPGGGSRGAGGHRGGLEDLPRS